MRSIIKSQFCTQADASFRLQLVVGISQTELSKRKLVLERICIWTMVKYRRQAETETETSGLLCARCADKACTFYSTSSLLFDVECTLANSVYKFWVYRLWLCVCWAAFTPQNAFVLFARSISDYACRAACAASSEITPPYTHAILSLSRCVSQLSRSTVIYKLFILPITLNYFPNGIFVNQTTKKINFTN